MNVNGFELNLSPCLVNAESRWEGWLPGYGSSPSIFIAQGADVWQVAVKLAKTRAVARYESVRDLKSSESNRDFNDLAATAAFHADLR